MYTEQSYCRVTADHLGPGYPAVAALPPHAGAVELVGQVQVGVGEEVEGAHLQPVVSGHCHDVCCSLTVPARPVWNCRQPAGGRPGSEHKICRALIFQLLLCVPVRTAVREAELLCPAPASIYRCCPAFSPQCCQHQFSSALEQYKPGAWWCRCWWCHPLSLRLKPGSSPWCTGRRSLSCWRAQQCCASRSPTGSI